MKSSWLKIALIALVTIVAAKLLVNLVPPLRPVAKFI